MKPYRLRVVRDTDITYPEGRASNAAAAAQYLRDHVFPKDESWRENAFLLTLDAAKNVTGVLHLSMGDHDSTAFDKKLIVKAALDTFSTCVLLAHNHPSGDPAPSGTDIRMTKELKQAVDAFGINLADHIVLAEDSFFSFAADRIQKYPN